MEHSQEFLNIISFESLYKAHMRARLSKRWKKEVIEYEMNLSSNLYGLHYDLLYDKYQLGGYHKFMIYDPKEREIQAITYRDRVIQHSLCDNFLMPLLEKRLFYYNVACRKNKGTSFATSTLKKYIIKYYKEYGNNGYFIKIDIKKYFDSINHEVLKKKLFLLNIPSDIKNLLTKIIDSYCYKDYKGIPMGNQTSQCFALLYLDCIDRLIKEKLHIKYYLRYMDDMILLVPEKKKAQEVFLTISKEIEKIDLCVNRKSQIITFENGVEFLGRRFFVSRSGKVVLKLKKEAKQRIIKKIRQKVYFINSGKINKVHLEKSFVSYSGIFKKINAYSFKKRLMKFL